MTYTPPLMSSAPTLMSLRLGSGACGHLDADMAAEHASERCLASLSGMSVDLAVLFMSMHHLGAARTISENVRKRLNAKVLVGCSAEAVLGGDTEMENAPGVSLLAASLPGVRVNTFVTDEVPGLGDPTIEDIGPIARACGFECDLRGMLLLADPFSSPFGSMLPMLTKARNLATGFTQAAADQGVRPPPIIGGLASAANRPSGNVLILNDRILRAGGVGISLHGNVAIDSLVSQGCRPIGPALVVTGVKGQMIMTLGGRPALDVLEEILDSLSQPMRQKLRRGLFLGRVVNEYKQRFGRDDFVIRTVVGVEKSVRAVAVADLLRVGQTVQFHVRDGQTASEDLSLLLDLQRLKDPPAGALLFTCNGRGTRLFDKPHHDASAISRAFASVPGEHAAKPGEALQSTPTPTQGPSIPLAGFFCAGEIGPIGDDVFMHGQTACAALFRSRE